MLSTCRYSQEVVTAYATWFASFGFDTYFTGTFRNRFVMRSGFEIEVGRSSGAAARAFQRYAGLLFPESGCVWATEKNPSREGWHLHCLICRPGVTRRVMWETWFKWNGVNRVLPVSEIGGVSKYVTKYCLSDAYDWGLINLGWSGEVGKPGGDLFVNRPEQVAIRAREAEWLSEKWRRTILQ